MKTLKWIIITFFVDIYYKGVRIPEDEIKYVFNKLYNVEKSRKLDLRSSGGLGLAIFLIVP